MTPGTDRACGFVDPECPVRSVTASVSRMVPLGSATGDTWHEHDVLGGIGLRSDRLEETAEPVYLVHVIGSPASLPLQHLGHNLEHPDCRSASNVRGRVDEGAKIGGIGQLAKRHRAHGYTPVE